MPANAKVAHVPTGAAFLMWEWSTFNVHLRWLLLKLGRGSSTLYVVNGVMMIIVWFCCRIAWGFHSSWQFYLDTSSDLVNPRDPSDPIPAIAVYLFLTANFSLNCLNTYWFWLMLKGVAQALGGRNVADALRYKSD